jgi:hypothetical protein
MADVCRTFASSAGFFFALDLMEKDHPLAWGTERQRALIPGHASCRAAMLRQEDAVKLAQ